MNIDAKLMTWFDKIWFLNVLFNCKISYLLEKNKIRNVFNRKLLINNDKGDRSPTMIFKKSELIKNNFGYRWIIRKQNSQGNRNCNLVQTSSKKKAAFNSNVERGKWFKMFFLLFWWLSNHFHRRFRLVDLVVFFRMKYFLHRYWENLLVDLIFFCE
jgi:hypothetical protein